MQCRHRKCESETVGSKTSNSWGNSRIDLKRSVVVTEGVREWLYNAAIIQATDENWQVIPLSDKHVLLCMERRHTPEREREDQFGPRLPQQNENHMKVNCWLPSAYKACV